MKFFKNLKNLIIKKMPHLLLLLSLFVISIIIGSYFPEKVPMHWNAHGMVDLYGTKFEVIFSLPIGAALVFIAGVFCETRFILPSNKMRSLISFFQFFFLMIFFILQLPVLLRPNNIFLEQERLMSIPAALLFAYVGRMMDKAEYQSLFGFKTKWTMESPQTWEKTNRLASILFSVLAVLMAIPVFIPAIFYYVFIIPVILVFIVLIFYSKVVFARYRDEQQKNEPQRKNSEDEPKDK